MKQFILDKNIKKAFLLFITVLSLYTKVLSQPMPVCPDQLVYGYGNTTATNGSIVAYNPALPISASNPGNTGIPLPTGAGGLAMLPNINGGPGPTFYVVVAGTYRYWNGLAWINTNHTAGSINFGGCGGAIYALVGSQVYAYYGNANAAPLVTIPSGINVADIVPDCDCNFWIMGYSTNNILRKYSPAGVVLATYTMTGFTGGSGFGFGFLGNTIYLPASGGMYTVTVGSSPTLNFTLFDPGTLQLTNDFANCPIGSAVPLTGTVTGGTLTCGSNTINMTATSTMSPVNYTWTGPSIIGAANGSVATAGIAGTYTCVISSPGGCSLPVTYTVAVVDPTCISVTSTSITCSSLGSATVTSLGGVGPFSYTWSPSNQVSAVANNLSPGTYTLTVLDLGSNTIYSTTTTFNSLIPLTGLVNSSSSITCNGAATGTANVTNISGGSGSQTYSWTNGFNGFTAPNPTNLTAGNYTVTVTDALTGCSISSGFFITQPAPLTLTIASGSPSTCAGSSVTLNGTASGGTPPSNGVYTYSWASGPGTFSYAPTQQIAGTYIYTLTAKDTYSCQVSQTHTINVIPNPTLAVISASICPFQIGNLTVTGASTYTWNNVSFGNTLSDNPTGNSTYSVVGTLAGCTASATGSISIKTVPVPTLTTNGPRCNGSVLSLNGSGGSFYNWTGPSLFTSVVQSPAINPVTLVHAGVYNLTVTAANGCTASANANVVVNTTPTLSASGSTVCTTKTISLTANASAGVTYSWTSPQAFASTLQNPFINNAVLAHTGGYTVRITSINGCTNSAVVQVSVTLPPSPLLSLSAGTICAQSLNGSVNTLTTSFSGANTYTLSAPANILVGNPSGPTSNLTSILPFLSAQVTITLTGSNGVCAVTDIKNFTIVDNPVVTITSANPVICAGETFTYNSQGASSYTWGPQSAQILTTGNASTAVVSPTTTSLFSVFGTSVGCNSATQTNILVVNPLPVVTLGAQSIDICLNNSALLSAGGTATSYSWSPANGLSSATGGTVSASPASQQNYTVTAALNSCTSTAVVSVYVLPLPVPQMNLPVPTKCLNESITLEASGGTSYSWQDPLGPVRFGQTVEYQLINMGYAGNYTLIVTDDAGCRAKKVFPVNIYNLPAGMASGSKIQGCIPFCSDFTFTSYNSIKSSWKINQQTFSGNNFSYCFTKAGDYSVIGELQDTTTGCTNSQSLTVKAWPLPKADFEFYPERPVETTDEVVFTNTSSGLDLKKWSWHFMDNQGYRSQHKHASYVFQNSGIYPIAMVVTDKFGCSDTVMKNINVEPDFSIFVPTAFTPNDDGTNDFFVPVMRGVKSFNLVVYDRWGEKVYQTSDVATSGWDGQFKGKACKEEIYVWKLDAAAESNATLKKGQQEKNLSGHVLLYR